jgi:hypothetical protein
MSTYDPRTLIRAFTVLQEALNRLNQTSGDTLKQSEHTQACAQERVTQALRWSAIASNQVKSDLEDVAEIEAEVNSLLLQSDSAVDIAHETIAQVEQAKQQAEATLRHWQSELKLALAWQARAEARLERAIQAYQQAERDYESAKRTLERAESSLERCSKDPERKNCASEQQAYKNARLAVAQAIEALKIAEIEVKAAQEDLEKAKARVKCCRAAVSYAEQAVQHAYTATEQAEQALNDAERSLENAESANRAANNAQTKAIEAEDLIEQLMIKVNQAERITNEAQIHNQTARNMSDSAYRLAVMGTQELRYRADHLTRLNQISSGFWSGVEKGVAVAQIFGGLFGNIMSGPVPNINNFGLQAGEDIVAEAGVQASSANEENTRRRKEETDSAVNAENEPKVSAPPDPS